MRSLKNLLILLILSQYALSANIIIVGAGVSGLTAAGKLAEAGHTVTVLEGRNRTCGRIWTYRAPFGADVVGTEADLGAGWIHGSSSSHPITQLFTNANLAQFTTTSDDSLAVYDSNGQKVSSSVADATWTKYRTALKDANSYASNNPGSVSASTSVGSKLKENTDNWNDELFRLTVSSSIEFDTAGDIDKLSLLRYNDDSRFEGVENLVTKGYDQLCDKILLKSTFTLNLNVNVTKINDNGSNGVEVVDANGNSYKGDRVIVTIPLGSLKRNQITFNPALSSEKQAAINRIGYGNVNKIVLEFPTQFWQSDITYIAKAASNQTNRGLWNYFLNAQPITKKPTLIGIAIGQNSYDVENLPQGGSLYIALHHLGIIYGNSTVGTPTKAVQSNWGKDYFAGYGTYSFGQVGQLDGDHEIVAKSQGNYYFAGEHTYVKYRGTVHGAYYSGLTAADNVINGLKSDSIKTSVFISFIILVLGFILF